MHHDLAGRSLSGVLDRRYVRVLKTLPSGCVVFEFALGDPDTCVEMILPAAAFAEFCASNHVQMRGDD
ncbi:MAG: hypothetical protein KGI67_08980 [Pseudomonadota bacterium]|nr:hypothetical protein [Pseudomonadota bacterium]